jgi:hypothetical protein
MTVPVEVSVQYTFPFLTAMELGVPCPEASTVGELPHPPMAHFMTVPPTTFTQYTLSVSSATTSGESCADASVTSPSLQWAMGHCMTVPAELSSVQ